MCGEDMSVQRCGKFRCVQMCGAGVSGTVRWEHGQACCEEDSAPYTLYPGEPALCSAALSPSLSSNQFVDSGDVRLSSLPS